MGPPMRVDVFADPGLAFRAVSQVLADSAEESAGEYVLSYNSRQIPLRSDGTLDLDTVREWARRDGADLIVIVTEIPRRSGGRPKMVALHFADGMAIISLPALGWLGLTRKLHQAVFDSLDALAGQQLPARNERRFRQGVVHHQHSDAGPSAFIASPWWWPGRIRLVLGMVRTNEPLSAVPKLSGVLAAAAASGAFGIFYSSIWQMADALPAWRLGLISVSAIVAMVLWLLFANRLWERPRRLGSLQEAAMYNASTVTTLGLAVTFLYLALFLGIFMAALVVIDAGFMAETIGSEASMTNYLDIAWLSASLGTAAGALGSNFDDEDDIRTLTHGRRQVQRFRERQESDENR